ncbi:dihydrodipicolinate synthase family protein [soil metagenome]
MSGQCVEGASGGVALGMATSPPPFTGVHPIVPTPFLEDGSLDLESVERLVDHQVDAGVDGIAILGFMGEAHKLTGAERRDVMQTAVARAGGRIIVWVGVRAFGTAGAIEQVQEAEAHGADAVFVAPIAPGTAAVLDRHYRAVASATALPVAIHDYPSEFGITIPADLIAALAVDGVTPYLKAEDPPVLVKQRRVLAGAPGRIGIFGGLGGQWVLEELENGAAGVMTGLAFPEVLVDIYRRYAAGDTAGASEVFDRVLPLIRYEFQPGIGVALRKHVFVRRGVFGTATVRPPHPSIDDATIREFERVAERCGLDVARAAPMPVQASAEVASAKL